MELVKQLKMKQKNKKDQFRGTYLDRLAASLLLLLLLLQIFTKYKHTIP